MAGNGPTQPMGTSGSTALPGWNYQSGPMAGAQPTATPGMAPPAAAANPLGGPMTPQLNRWMGNHPAPAAPPSSYDFSNAFPNAGQGGGQFVWGTPTPQSGLPYGGMSGEITVPQNPGSNFFSSIYGGGQRPDFNSYVDSWRQHQQAMAARGNLPAQRQYADYQRELANRMGNRRGLLG